MKPALIVLSFLVLLAAIAGCTQQEQQQQPSAEFSPEETTETVNSLDQSFVNDSQDVEIGQMV